MSMENPFAQATPETTTLDTYETVEHTVETAHDDYRNWSVEEILEFGKELKMPGGTIETASLDPRIAGPVTFAATDTAVTISFKMDQPGDMVNMMKAAAERQGEQLDEQADEKGTIYSLFGATVRDDGNKQIEISVPNNDARLDFESLGISSLFKKDTLSTVEAMVKEGSVSFVGRESIPVTIAHSPAGIEALIPKEKEDRVRLYKGASVSTALKIMKEGIFSDPTSPNLSEVYTGEVAIALEGYAEQQGDKRYSALLIIDCMPDEYESQGGYEQFGVAKKEFSGTADRLVRRNIKHTRHIPPDRITEVIFVEA